MSCFSTVFFAAFALVEVLLLARTVSSGSTRAPPPPRTLPVPGDQCDWTGSGGGGRGVRPIYLRCARGSVSWRYPRGALRVVLSGVAPPRGFRTCTKISGPARVYLEAKGALRLLYSPYDGKDDSLHRCFYSTAGQTAAALYVEADESASFVAGRETARLQYDLEANADTESGVIDEEAQCRPCSKRELAEAYCKSDLVARGTVSAVQKKPDLEAAELILRATKILRNVDDNEDNELLLLPPPPQPQPQPQPPSPDAGRFERDVRVRVPSACDARHGQGEFVIMAKRRLGDLTLVCAPRLEAWAEAVAELAGAPCLLKS